MDELYVSQLEIVEAIKKLERNFKKDGHDRKTLDYFQRRIQALDSYWSEYQYNHDRITSVGSRTHPYFVNSEYEQTLKLYNSIKRQFSMHLQLLKEGVLPSSESENIDSSRPGTSGQQPEEKPKEINNEQSGDSVQLPPEARMTPVRSQGSLSKLDEMLRKQSANFKAFDRTMANTHVDSLSEKWEFEDALRSLQSRWSVIDSLHWEIECEIDGEDVWYENKFNRYEIMFNSLKKEINGKMWSECHREKATPQIDVPIFSGNFHSWVSFKDLFIETIHKNRSLSNSQKMQYLKSKLRNEPEKLILHLHVTAENYQVAWDILNQRYNNTKLIFNSHMNILMNLPNMQVQSAAGIKRIHDTTNECLHAVKNLGVDISNWDPLVVYLIAQKMDSDTHKEYIESLRKPRDLPSLQEFLDFLEMKFTALESSKRKSDNVNLVHPQQRQQQQQQYNRYSQPFLHPKKPQYLKPINNFQNVTNKTYNSNHKTFRSTIQKCLVCGKDHGIFNCKTFLEFQPEVKRQTLLKLSLCKNCLYKHEGKECLSTRTCRVCKGQHNTILHELFTVTLNDPTPSSSNKESMPTKNSMSVLQEDTQEVLLATALIRVQAADGTDHIMRALIDQGSQTSLITENAAQILGLRRKQCKGIIIGVGAKENNCKGVMNICIKSMYNDFSIDADVFIMNHAVNNLPNQSFNKPNWSYIENIQLADPEFHRSRSVDLLLGADVYPLIIMSGIINSNHSMPIAQQTRLGWILCGNVKSYQCNVVMLNIEDIHNFWTIEDINDSNDMSEEDNQCVKLFESTTTRNMEGRYVVRLPLHPDIDRKLGDSKRKALAQFYQIEKRFRKDKKLSADYKSFITEYIKLNHMRLALSNRTPSFYMPHHCVQRADSATTSLRVVFNASQPSSNGLSLNDLMYRGPNLQQDLMLLVTRWRQYKYAMTADIEKMFRQVLVHEDDQKYQKIIWRDFEDQILKEYELSTVTYGTKAAPFLAMGVLKQLAMDEGHRFPEAAKAVQEQFYTDDLLTGGYNVQSAKQLQSDLIELAKLGGFNLRKWASNTPELLEKDVSTDSNEDFFFKHKESTKTLGLIWNSKDDSFTFQCKMDKQPHRNDTPTKRILLGEISKIFDPLGWLAPAVIQLKLLFQSVWLTDLKWDDVIPEEINAAWNKLRLDIENISQIKIPRWLLCEEQACLQLHGFCDASNKAYACVIYVRSQKDDTATVVLLAAKTKLVPTTKSKVSNSEVSLPRLELCGALLLAKLMEKMVTSLREHKVEVYGWCDSTAVLGWLHGDPNRWKPFVANRVKKVTEVMPSNCWRYIKTQENPADCASRGMNVEQLQCFELWWNGPKWLKSFNKEDSNQTANHTTNLEVKKLQSNILQTDTTMNENIFSLLINKYSNLMKITRIPAWVMRAVTRNHMKQSYLTCKELEVAQMKIIKYVQQCEFSEDIAHLKKHGTVHSSSRLFCLNPFIDNDGLLRVGGRLKLCNIDYNMKHPKILPHKHVVTNLLINYAHEKTFHGGARLTHSWLRQQYWILSGNRAVKGHLRACVLCRRHTPSKHHQLMGNLPESRTNPTRPFYHTGVDYTGHIDVKSSKGRGIKTSKGYVAVFICMTTKAVHLELVSDLSASAFLAALRRMAAKRGTPRHIYSDNATNFTKAHRILSQEYVNLTSVFTDRFFTEISEMQINWHFNAPSWPSAGGLWESAVKSLKYHLRRVVGDQKLTYEEFYTLLSQLEACLNSRPLCAMSEDLNDIDYLTPSHFLASGPNLTIFETERDERTRWQLTQKIFNDIWRRWRTEYLVQLSARSKWQRSQPNIKMEDVVIIHDDNLPAGRWALGRVVDLHPGTDGHVRVVSVKTKNGVLKRPIVKLSILPVKQHEEETVLPEKQKESNKSIKPKSNFTSMMLSIFLVLNFLTLAFGSYNITNLNDTKGFYFDKVANMQIVRDDWKVIVYYNMDPYWEGMKAFEKYYKILIDACEKTNTVHCNVIIMQLKLGLSELQYYDRILLNQQFSAYDRRRSRRGLINGVGYIAHSLFGVLDEEFAEKYRRDIELVNNNQKHLALLWKNQTSIVEAEYNLIKRMEDSMYKQHKLINQRINSLEKATNTLNSEVQNLDNENEFILTTIIATNMLSKLSSIQEAILDIVMNIYNGKLNVHLLTPSQLQEELNIIAGQLPSDLSLPVVNIPTDLRYIYQLLRVRARTSKPYLIFEVKIPLISRETYQFYNVMSIPKKVGKNAIRITPVSENLAINLRKDTYLPSPDLNACLISDPQTYLCPNQGPIYQLKSDHSLCIKHHEQGSCMKEITPCKDQWRMLKTPNTFFYFCCDQCSFRIICDEDITVKHVSNTGIISLSPGCILKGDGFTIYSHKELSNKLNVGPQVYVHEIAPINHVINVSTPNIQWHPENGSKEEQFYIESIRTQIEHMRSEGVLTDRISYHDVHHYIAIYMVVVAVIIVGVVVAWRRYRRLRHVHLQQAASSSVQRRNSECGSANASAGDSVISLQYKPISSRFINRASSPIVRKSFDRDVRNTES